MSAGYVKDILNRWSKSSELCEHNEHQAKPFRKL